MIRRPPRSTLSSSSAASDVYKRQGCHHHTARVRFDQAVIITLTRIDADARDYKLHKKRTRHLLSPDHQPAPPSAATATTGQVLHRDSKLGRSCRFPDLTSSHLHSTRPTSSFPQYSLYILTLCNNCIAYSPRPILRQLYSCAVNAHTRVFAVAPRPASLHRNG